MSCILPRSKEEKIAAFILAAVLGAENRGQRTGGREQGAVVRARLYL